MAAEAVKVYCRFRPLSTAETARGSSGGSIARIDGPTVTLGAAADGPTEHTFSFDGIFGPDAAQADVYDVVARPLVGALFNGINCCLLAYGQTGSGKTFTMSGPPGAALVQAPGTPGGGAAATPASEQLEPPAGVIPRAVADIFATALAAPEECTFAIKASYVEIYQERVRDLLAPLPATGGGLGSPGGVNSNSDNLAIGEDTAPGGRGIYVKGAREEYVTSPGELLALMAAGNANRATAATGMNAGSSRSHAIFTISLTAHDAVAGLSSRSKLVLCDLAGSETVSKTGVSGTQLEELKKINKSLSALGLVIHALTEGGGGGGPNSSGGGCDGPRSHVPYRDSKLTRLLQECLGGNARTALLCAASPSAWNAPETLSTLRFGARAKRVRNTATAHRERTPAETAKHAEACEAALTGFDAAAAAALAALEAAVARAAAAAASGSADGGHASAAAALGGAVSSLLLARRQAAAVLAASTDLRLATAATALATAGGSGPALVPVGGGAGDGGGAATARSDDDDEMGVASAVAAAAAATASIAPAHAPADGADSGATAAVGDAASTAPAATTEEVARLAASNASLSAEVASLTSQLADMVELLTEAGGEIATLQAQVVAAAGDGGDSLGASARTAAGLGVATAAATTAAGGAGSGKDATVVVSPVSAATPSAAAAAGSSVTAADDAILEHLTEELAAAVGEAAMLRGELEVAAGQAGDLRSELLDSKARIVELEDALERAQAQQTQAAVAAEAAAAASAGAGATRAAPTTAPLSAAVASSQDAALSKLSAELASRNALIAQYEGRLTSLMTRMATAAATGDMKLLEGGSLRLGGDGDLDDGGNGGAGGGGGAVTPVKSIRGRGGHAGAAAAGGRPPGAAALGASPPRGYGPPHHGGNRPGGGLVAGASPDSGGGGGDEGLLGRLWRRISGFPPAVGSTPPQHQQQAQQAGSPGGSVLARALIPPPTHRDVTFSTSSDLHLLSPSRSLQPQQQQQQSQQQQSQQQPLSVARTPIAAAAPSPGATAAGGSLTARLAAACEAGDVGAVRTLLSSPSGPGAAVLPDASGRPPVIYAARGGHVVVVEALVAACGGGLLACADRDGRGALHYAARKGHAPMVAWLLQQHGSGGSGCDPSAPDAHGLTPLHQAALGRSAPAARLLLAAGADPGARDRHGATPLALAAQALGDGGALPTAVPPGGDPAAALLAVLERS